MTLRTLFRHSMIIFLLLLALIQNIGWDNFLIWAKLNQNFLLFWLASLLLLSVLGYLLATKQWLAYLLAQLFAPPEIELQRHADGLNSVASRLLLTWSLCPKCLAWWFCLIFSGIYHALYWHYWFTGIYFAFLGASIGAIFSVTLFLITRQSQIGINPEDTQ